MQKGKKRTIIGAVLIILQILSLAGNAKAGIGIQLSFNSIGVFVYDLFSLIGYCLVGIVGLVLLISGIVAYRKDA